jgi:hypothetical protein
MAHLNKEIDDTKEKIAQVTQQVNTRQNDLK